MSGLGSVFKRGKERAAPVETAPLEPPKTRARAKQGRRAQGYAQWNVLIPEEVKLEAQIKCKREKRDMADVTEKLLAAWLEGRLDV
jgi:hypothetical protein